MMSMIVSRAPGWEPPKKQAALSQQKIRSGKVTNTAQADGSTTDPKPALVADTSETATSQTEN